LIISSARFMRVYYRALFIVIKRYQSFWRYYIYPFRNFILFEIFRNSI
jgi:hypothetical protein